MKAVLKRKVHDVFQMTQEAIDDPSSWPDWLPRTKNELLRGYMSPYGSRDSDIRGWALNVDGLRHRVPVGAWIVRPERRSSRLVVMSNEAFHRVYTLNTGYVPVADRHEVG